MTERKVLLILVVSFAILLASMYFLGK